MYTKIKLTKAHGGVLLTWILWCDLCEWKVLHMFPQFVGTFYSRRSIKCAKLFSSTHTATSTRSFLVKRKEHQTLEITMIITEFAGEFVSSMNCKRSMEQKIPTSRWSRDESFCIRTRKNKKKVTRAYELYKFNFLLFFWMKCMLVRFDNCWPYLRGDYVRIFYLRV